MGPPGSATGLPPLLDVHPDLPPMLLNLRAELDVALAGPGMAVRVHKALQIVTEHQRFGDEPLMLSQEPLGETRASHENSLRLLAITNA